MRRDIFFRCLFDNESPEIQSPVLEPVSPDVPSPPPPHHPNLPPDAYFEPIRDETSPAQPAEREYRQVVTPIRVPAIRPPQAQIPPPAVENHVNNTEDPQ